MRPDHKFPTKSRRTVSKNPFTFDGLRRRLSTRADSDFLDGAQAQAEVSDILRREGFFEVLNPIFK